MKKPLCVVLGDIHFTVSTLELASSALRQAQKKANELNVPLVLNGDTLDSKSIIRGEVANRLIEILTSSCYTHVYINTGNHDMLNHHGKDSSLRFLRPYAQVISTPTYVRELDSWIIPYFHNGDELREVLKGIKKGSRLFVHQGVMGADMGAYAKDSSSLAPEEYADFRILASHYHKRQDIKCGRSMKGGVGLFSFLGSPYSITFTESGDGPKGYNIVYDDGSLELVPTNLRRHIKLEITADELSGVSSLTRGNPEQTPIKPEDLVWIRVTGPYSELQKLTKQSIAKTLQLPHTNFKLEKVPTQVTKDESPVSEKLTDLEVYDKLVDGMDESAAQKKVLKSLARELMSV